MSELAKEKKVLQTIRDLHKQMSDLWGESLVATDLCEMLNRFACRWDVAEDLSVIHYSPLHEEYVADCPTCGGLRCFGLVGATGRLRNGGDIILECATCDGLFTAKVDVDTQQVELLEEVDEVPWDPTEEDV